MVLGKMIRKKVKIVDPSGPDYCWVLLSDDMQYILGWSWGYRSREFIYPNPVKINVDKEGFKYVNASYKWVK